MLHHKSELPSFKYYCNKCPYATDNKTTFKNHDDVHLPNRPFKCDICGNGFLRLGNLNHHMNIHNGDPQLNLNQFKQMHSVFSVK